MEWLQPLSSQWQIAFLVLCVVMGSLLWRGHRQTSNLAGIAAKMQEQLIILTRTVEAVEGRTTNTEHTLIANLLAAGEFPLGLVYAHRMEELKKKGAPVEWVTTTDPIPAELHPIQIGAKAPNPNAAKLFIEFMASKEGQTIMRDLVRIPAHPEVQLPGVRTQDLRMHGVGIVPPSRANQIIKEWREIFNPSGA